MTFLSQWKARRRRVGAGLGMAAVCWIGLAAHLALAQPPRLVGEWSEDRIRLSWPEAYTGWTLVMGSNLVDGATAGWSSVPGATTTNAVSMAMDPDASVAFFLLQGEFIQTNAVVYEFDGSVTGRYRPYVVEPIVLPIEVMGPPPHIEPVTFDLGMLAM